MSNVAVRRALLSVSDKTGLEEFAKQLHKAGIALVSTGGTHQTLAAANLPTQELSAVTGFPEILEGRVKTLHPAIHAGILARHDDPTHQAVLAERNIQPFQLVVCNLYPFERIVMEPGRSKDDIIENIDIGGPALIRAAAKNYHSVAVVCDPSQYDGILRELETGNGTLSGETRLRLAVAAFKRIATYDQAIATWFGIQSGPPETFPGELNLRFRKRADLRYGENPHQKAAFYVDPQSFPPCLAHGELLHGKELSFNNLLDLDAALALVRDFSGPTAVIIKHNNPCGVGLGATLSEACSRALEGDEQSSYGGIFGFNQEMDAATAELLSEPNRFVEAIIAPSFAPGAVQVLTTRPKWKDSVRLVSVGRLSGRSEELDYRRIDGGLLAQTPDLTNEDWSKVKTVTKKAPSAEQLADLVLAWKVVRQVKSNAIVLAKDSRIVGVGAGQMSRVDAVHLAIKKAGDRSKGAVLASDAFLPFRDNVDVAALGGIAAIAQPGGSVRDAEVIAGCDEHGIAMVFTEVRHFRH